MAALDVVTHIRPHRGEWERITAIGLRFIIAIVISFLLYVGFFSVHMLSSIVIDWVV